MAYMHPHLPYFFGVLFQCSMHLICKSIKFYGNRSYKVGHQTEGLAVVNEELYNRH